MIESGDLKISYKIIDVRMPDGAEVKERTVANKLISDNEN
jgi:hypothetical protein